MGRFINEKDIINSNIFLYEKRMESQYTRFLEKNPTFVEYYHINDTESTVDNGLLTVEDIIGGNSPLKYQKIKDFPVYGIDQIQLDLSEGDSGLSSSFDGDLIILPNTIVPYPNDYFIFTYLERYYLFMVTDIVYDTIKSNNFYKINYTLKDISEDKLDDLESGVIENYTCIFRNIGTKDKCIIKDNEFQQYKNLMECVYNINNSYLIYYYSKKFNCFLIEDSDGELVYDRYLSHFITRNRIFEDEYQYNTLVLTNENSTPRFLLEYTSSIFSDIEKGLKPRIQYVCNDFINSMSSSVFAVYKITDSVSTVKITSSNDDEGRLYLPTELYNAINNPQYPTVDLNYIYQLVADFFNGKINTISYIDVDRLYNVEITAENFNNMITVIPIFLFILDSILEKFISNDT